MTSGTAWRGLTPYGEDDRAALHGRDRDRDELVKLVTEPSFRAGLLFGETGVGKTSLLAAVLPVLREQGVIVVSATDPLSPGESLAAALTASGARSTAGEVPSNYLARITSNAPPGQLYLFVIDD